MLDVNDLIYGKFPENDYEIVIDKLAVKKLFDNKMPQQAGILSEEQLLNREVTINNMDTFKIVGITDLQSPSIYAMDNQLMNIIANTNEDYQVYDSKAWFVDKAIEPGMPGDGVTLFRL